MGLKATSPADDEVGPSHVFDIGGDRLRSIAAVDHEDGSIFIRRVLDHADQAAGTWKV